MLHTHIFAAKRNIRYCHNDSWQQLTAVQHVSLILTVPTTANIGSPTAFGMRRERSAPALLHALCLLLQQSHWMHALR
jgi:hypothetical protein